MSDKTPYLLKQLHQTYTLFQKRLKQSISPVVLVYFDADLLLPSVRTADLKDLCIIFIRFLSSN